MTNDLNHTDAASDSTPLAEIYEKQRVMLEAKKNDLPPHDVPHFGVVLFTTGLIFLFILFEFENLLIPILPLSIIFIGFGIFLLRKRITVIKPLVGGSILFYFGFGAIMAGLLLLLEGINMINTDGILIIIPSIIIIILGIPIAAGAICAIIRKKQKFSLIGGILSIFIAIMLDPIALLLSVAAILLLFWSEIEFDDD